MKHTLKTLAEWSAKHYPELRQAHIEAYCNEAGKLKKEDVDYHYGYNSLKWLIYALRENIGNKELERLFYQIMLERKALEKSFYDLQYNILSFPAAAAYRQQLKNTQPDTGPLIPATMFGYQIVINPTTQNLTSVIFKKYNADAIIFRNPSTGDAGIVLNVTGRFFRPPVNGDTSGLFLSISQHESGWIPEIPEAGENSMFNMLIRKGHEMPTVHTIETLLAATGKFLRPESTLFFCTYSLPEGKQQSFTTDNLHEAVSICTANSKKFIINDFKS